MKSKVYFTSVKDSADIQGVKVKLKALIKESRVMDFIRREHEVAVKMHFGEEGTDGFVRPAFVRLICDEIIHKGASAFLSDTNTLYRGKRLNSQDHLKLAAEHGFTEEAVGVEIIIPDESRRDDTSVIQINQKLIKSAKIASIFTGADALIAVSHFKGHILTSFGGALKNIGMGCATRAGKLAQHCDVSPVVYADKCTGCAECRKVCSVGAIQIKNKKSVIDTSKCIGCASCMAACPTTAMFIDFGAGDKVQEKMVEYALAAIRGKKGKTGFLNFAVRISKECDCWPLDNPRIAPDVGILASLDPVSIDKASFDLVNDACGRDIFKEAHPDYDGVKHLKYAQEIGLGNLDYELIRLG